MQKKLFRITLFKDDQTAEKIALFAAYSNGESEENKPDIQFIHDYYHQKLPENYRLRTSINGHNLFLYKDDQLQPILELEEIEICELKNREEIESNTETFKLN